MKNLYHHKLTWLFLIVIFSLCRNVVAQERQLSVFSKYEDEGDVWMKYRDNSNALYDHLTSLAMKCLKDREREVSGLKSTEEWKKYLDRKRIRCFGNLKNYTKTPLKPKITGKLDRSNYSVEKVVFESIPGFYVTGCIFIPKAGQKPFPAVLVAIGHSQAAFRRDLYQQNILNLVAKGFVVFTFDPLGQGERTQYFDTGTQKSLIGGTVFEHSFAGAQSLLLGNSISDNFVWDGVRALDYLFTRPEVDTTRIGMTGISGGGTQTAYLSAWDKRIKAAAPECYITSYKRLFESIGPQDAEQNFFNGLKSGIDHADLLCMRAPNPTMVISTTQDFFSIQGARETYEKVRDVFRVFNLQGNITMTEANGPHGSEKANREKMYAFFRQHLNLPGSSKDEEVKYFSEKELTVTSLGQVNSEYNSKTVFDLNQEKANQILNARLITDFLDLNKNKKFLMNKVLEVSGYDSTRRIRSVVFTGKVEEQGYQIEKYFIEGMDFDYPIPFVLIKPYSENKQKLLLWLSSTGKQELLSNKQEIEKYLNMGYTILAPDLIGSGELKNTSFKGDSYMDFSYNIWFAANLVGKSIPGMQASDLNVLFRSLKGRNDLDLGNITAMVKDEICSSYLHFAVFNKCIKKTILFNPLISYENIILTRIYDPRYLWTSVPGAVAYYDLPFLESLLAPNELVIIDPFNASGKKVTPEVLDKQLFIVKQNYKYRNADDQLRICTDTDPGEYLN